MSEKKRTIYEFNIYGESVTINAPTMRQVHKFSKKVEKDKGGEIELSIAFLVDCGLDEDLAWDMEALHLKEVIETMTGQKKA